MPKFTVKLIETLTHRVVVEAATEVAAMRAAETFLTETDHNDNYLFVAGGHEATHTEPAADDAEPDVKDKSDMAVDPAQRHQLEQDVLTAEWEAERVAACDDAIALLREIADLEIDVNSHLNLGSGLASHTGLLSRIAAFFATHDL
ncbi:hypothetical protein [Cypionkella sp.]|uniref:hypothetical protein n=1 Tax=Cypionkella sp. TaxID=2811411 RepID=UPI00272461F1|nr:hypothetical protein [Cypionkella sp.]MDO8984495.1 hypothetical protein [Cypionkella sp.]MDP2049700.1 hypothetical protein [Cypionkella sp.]